MINKVNMTFWILFLLVSFPILIFAEDGDGGQAGAFLRLPVNARANGMGSAFTAVVQDPSAGWWNPAGFGFVEEYQVSGMYSVMSMDRSHNFAGLSLPFGRTGTLGIHWLKFGVTDIDGRDITGQPTGKFDDSEMALGLSYAYKFYPVFSIGMTGKYLHHSLQDFSGSGFGLDAGAMLNFNDKYHFGILVQNITGSLKWNTDSELKEKFPKVYRAGIGLKPLILPVTIVLDAAKVQDQSGVKIYTGAEVGLFQKMLTLRGGYADKDITVGASVGWQIPTGFGFQFDYAFLQDVLEERPTSQISFLLFF